MTIGVTGAGGQLGGLVLDNLLAKGVSRQRHRGADPRPGQAQRLCRQGHQRACRRFRQAGGIDSLPEGR